MKEAVEVSKIDLREREHFVNRTGSLARERRTVMSRDNSGAGPRCIKFRGTQLRAAKETRRK